MKKSCINYGLGTALVFDLLLYIAFDTTSYFKYGNGLEMSKVFTTELGYFWLAWTVAAFIVGYGFRRDYVASLNALAMQFPDVPSEIVRREAKSFFAAKYSRWVWPMFAILPFVHYFYQEAIHSTTADWTLTIMSWMIAAITFGISRRH